MMKIIKKVGIIFIGIATMFTMSACSKINYDTANDVSIALKEKYGENFNVVKIGDRFNRDSTKLYVYPENDDTLIFTAYIDKETGRVSDNYVRCKIADLIEQDLLGVLCEIDTDVNVKVYCDDISDERNTDLSLEEFKEKYTISKISIYMPIKIIDVNSKNILHIISSCQEKQKELKCDVLIHMYSMDVANFEKCIVDMKYENDISSTWFSIYEYKGKIDFAISSTGTNVECEQIIENLIGE